MSKLNKIFIYAFLLGLIVFVLWGGFYIFKQKQIEKFLSNTLPGLTAPGKVNLPGKLVTPIGPTQAQNLDAAKIIEWTNHYRTQEGLPKLVLNPVLTKAAQTKVDDMFKKQYFEHISPEGVSPDQLVLAAGYNYKVTGENLALGGFKDEKDLVDAWMGSPGHRANILNPDYTEIGVSSGLNQYEERGSTWISVQEFGRPAPNCAKPDSVLAQTLEAKKTQYETLITQYQDFLNSRLTWGSVEKKQAKEMQEELDDLYSEINTLVAQYNTQVDSYNKCIQQ